MRDSPFGWPILAGMGGCSVMQTRVALPANCDGPGGSACSLERVADGGWIPLAPALGGGDAIGVESVRDRGQALAGCPLAPDPPERVLGHLRRPTEPDALRARGGERRLCPL